MCRWCACGIDGAWSRVVSVSSINDDLELIGSEYEGVETV
jgi:hypothetical protein